VELERLNQETQNFQSFNKKQRKNNQTIKLLDKVVGGDKNGKFFSKL
jgi:hypothetical protein